MKKKVVTTAKPQTKVATKAPIKAPVKTTGKAPVKAPVKTGTNNKVTTDPAKEFLHEKERLKKLVTELLEEK